MYIERTLKKKIIDEYNAFAHKLYTDSEIVIPRDKLRLVILQVVTEHILSKQNEALTTAKRLTKHKVTRAINKDKAVNRNTSIPAKELTF